MLPVHAAVNLQELTKAETVTPPSEHFNLDILSHTGFSTLIYVLFLGTELKTPAGENKRCTDT